MKVGDLVKPKHESVNNGVGLGIVLKVEKNFFRAYNDYFDDRLTIYWTSDEKSAEPDSYVKKVAEDKKNPLTTKKE